MSACPCPRGAHTPRGRAQYTGLVDLVDFVVRLRMRAGFVLSIDSWVAQVRARIRTALALVFLHALENRAANTSNRVVGKATRRTGLITGASSGTRLDVHRGFVADVRRKLTSWLCGCRGSRESRARHRARGGGEGKERHEAPSNEVIARHAHAPPLRTRVFTSRPDARPHALTYPEPPTFRRGFHRRPPPVMAEGSSPILAR